nr:metallophosphoesterase [Deltaproteobacteria bacterium]
TTAREWLREAWLDLSDQELADALSEATGRDISIYRTTQMRQRLGLKKTRSGQPVVFEESQHRRYDSPPVLKTANLLVLADVEAPLHDAEWCSDVVALAKAWDVDIVLSAGDLLHFKALSSFFKRFLTDEEQVAELTDEVTAAGDFVGVLLNEFKEVHCILGNHENRLTRSLGVNVRTRILQKLLGYDREPRLNIHPYYFAEVETGVPLNGMGDRWRVSHPRNTSVIPVRVAGRMADKYEAHYLSAHGHDWGSVTSAAGRYASALGICVDPLRLDYYATRDNLRPRMQQGALILRDGYPYLLHPEYAPPGRFM